MSAKLVYGVQPEPAHGDKNIMRAGVGRAEINEPIDVVIHSGFAQDGAGDVANANVGEGQAVRTSPVIHVIRRLTSAGARHELHHHCWIAGDMLGQVWNERARAPFAYAAGRAAADERDGFALKKVGLR